MTTSTLPPEIAAAMAEAPYSVENLGQYIDHFVIQYFGPERTVIPDIPAVFDYESDAEELAQELNFELRQHRVAALIAEREKALVEALKAAARNLWNSGTAYSCQGTLTAAKEADTALEKAEAR